MKLWRISQDVNLGYDVAIVAARTEEAARLINPDSHGWSPLYCDKAWADEPGQVMVELIGTAKRGTKAGLVFASYREW
jgi:hypothetical protein